MRPGETRRRLLWAMAALLVALGAYTAVTAVRLWLMYDEMVEARGLLLSVEGALRQEGLGASPAALAEAESQALTAQGRFHCAQNFLDGEPLLRVLGWVPWIGTQISAARALADIGYEGSGIGVEGIAALHTLNAIRADEEGALGENVGAYLEAIEPRMAAVEEGLAAIRERREGIDTRWLLPPLSSFVQQVDARLARVEESVDRYYHGRAVADYVLGFDEPTRYLVLGLDNTELLPGGGLIGMYGVVTFEDGRVVERSFGEVEELFQGWQARSGGEYIEPPGPLKRYLLRDWTWSFGVSNWSPDFPTSARQALFFYDRSGADPVDGVIALDFAALEGLLAVLGPKEVNGYGVTIDSHNVTEEILAHIAKPLHPWEGDHAFAGAVATEIVDGAFAVDQEQWVPLLDALDRLAEERHLFLYTNNRRVQNSVRELGWAGQVRNGPGDYLMAVNASVHSTKLNLVLQERMEVNVHLNGDGSAQNAVTLHYENRLGEWADTHDPDLVSGLMLSGLYGGYLRLLVPPQAHILDLQLDGRTVGAEEITEEAGKASFSRYLPLPRDSQAALLFIYDVPAVVSDSQATHEYRLLVQKQPGVRAAPLEVAVTLPPGARVESVSLNGEHLPDDPLEIQTELSVDLELVVRYEPA
jgi:hypothetical protein